MNYACGKFHRGDILGEFGFHWEKGQSGLGRSGGDAGWWTGTLKARGVGEHSGSHSCALGGGGVGTVLGGGGITLWLVDNGI